MLGGGRQKTSGLRNRAAFDGSGTARISAEALEGPQAWQHRDERVVVRGHVPHHESPQQRPQRPVTSEVRMAGSSLLALLDDIASLLDDIAVMSKLAVKKTAGVLGDDIALNAEQVAGVNADRELPVVWAVAKGSLVNKAILVPAALGISALLPWMVIPLLMIGGAFLCYEGFEKVFHKLQGRKSAGEASVEGAPPAPTPAPSTGQPSHTGDLAELEREKIKGAVRTDFILSAEIMVISLGVVAKDPLVTQVGVLVAVALLMTVGVYGLVAGIIKLDDFGLYLAGRSGDGAAARVARGLGRALVTAAPGLMRTLSVVGTAAMFLVGAGIFTHNIPALHHLLEALMRAANAVPGVGGALAFAADLAIGLVLGLAVGAVVVAGKTLATRLLGRGSPA